MTDSSGHFSLQKIFNILDEEDRFHSWVYDKYRPTVSCVLIHNGSVLLVQPSQDPTRQNWIPPQGGVARRESIFSAVRREMAEELNRKWSIDKLQSQVKKLGWYVNTIRNDDKPKLIVSVGLFIEERDISRIKLNEENRKHCLVVNQYDMWNRMSGTRLVKRLGTWHSVNAAHEQGMLNWSCKDAIEQFHAGEAMAAA